MDRAELAQFLGTRRARLRPHEAGLPSTARRRVPGLRRHEVAQLAGVSVEYYTRLEQGRGAHPSRQVLSALARALMLTADERDYLFRLAGHASPASPGMSGEVTPGIRYLLDSLAETPAFVVDAKYELLAWNRLATLFIGDPATFPEGNRNMLRWAFQLPPTDTHWSDDNHLNFARHSVADLRAAYANYPGDPGIAALVTELLGCSPRFAEMWASHDVKVRRRIVKRVEHPQVGWLEFECQVLHVSTADQRLIVYCAEPGSPTHDAFRRLARQAATTVA
ncbi:MAG TPA: helix-turn-helix transcriptional regulator [Candidatus Limnocylindrales bacterium]|nr:helix-turn-helix transcriptional regulator [Candidatus Limnocylindrales bacterium]